MRTRQMQFRQHTQCKLAPSTMVTVPASYLSDECASCTEVRIGCDICFVSEACTSDVYCTAEDVTTPFPLHQLDFRVPYHFGKDEKMKTREEETTYDESRQFIVWYEVKTPADSLLLDKLNSYRRKRNYPDMFEDNDGRIQTWAAIGGSIVLTTSSGLTVAVVDHTQHNNDDNDDSGNEDNGDSDANRPLGSQQPLTEGDADAVVLCSNCYHWFTMLHDDHKDTFKRVTTAEIGYRQWLEEHEDELIVSTN